MNSIFYQVLLIEEPLIELFWKYHSSIKKNFVIGFLFSEKSCEYTACSFLFRESKKETYIALRNNKFPLAFSLR
jgi:hypothetical protein